MAQHLTKTLYVVFSFVTHILDISSKDIPKCRVSHDTSLLDQRRLRTLHKSPTVVLCWDFNSSHFN